MPIPAGPDIDPADLPPEHSLQVGDVRQPTLDVAAFDGSPGDATTAAACAVTAPGAAPQTLDTATPDGGATWIADAYTCGTPTGRWVETWTVTGRGADTFYTVVLVHAAPTAGGQTWIPTREQVAAIIPRRTHVGAADGWGKTQGTFSDLTRPNARQCDDLIIQSAQWVELATGPIANPAYVETATTCAALRTAGMIELTWPDSSDEISNAKVLLEQADRLRRDLAAANTTLEGADPIRPAVLPVWSFPAATELRF